MASLCSLNVKLLWFIFSKATSRCNGGGVLCRLFFKLNQHKELENKSALLFWCTLQTHLSNK